TTRSAGSVTHKLLRHRSGAFESGLRFCLIALIQIKSPFQQSFWARASVWVKQCLSAKLLQQFKSISELPLQHQNPHSRCRNEAVWIEFPRHQGQLFFDEPDVALPCDCQSG